MCFNNGYDGGKRNTGRLGDQAHMAAAGVPPARFNARFDGKMMPGYHVRPQSDNIDAGCLQRWCRIACRGPPDYGTVWSRHETENRIMVLYGAGRKWKIGGSLLTASEEQPYLDWGVPFV